MYDRSLFDKESWIASMLFWCRYPKEFVTVARVELSQQDAPVIYGLTAKCNRPYKTQWFVTVPYGDIQEWGIEAPTPEMWPRHDIYNPKELLDLIREHRPRMRMIQGVPTKGTLPAAEFPEPVEENVIFEVDGMNSEQLIDAEYDVAEALDEAGCPMDCQVDGGSTLVLIGPEEQKAEVLAVLRRELKKIVPKEEHPHIEITRINPDDTRTSLRLIPPKRSSR